MLDSTQCTISLANQKIVKKQMLASRHAQFDHSSNIGTAWQFLKFSKCPNGKVLVRAKVGGQLITKGYAGQNCLLVLLVDLVRHVRGNEAWSDRIHADVAAGHLSGHCLRQSKHSSLHRRRICNWSSTNFLTCPLCHLMSVCPLGCSPYPHKLMSCNLCSADQTAKTSEAHAADGEQPL